MASLIGVTCAVCGKVISEDNRDIVKDEATCKRVAIEESDGKYDEPIS